jgi:Tol biopolymer transport system component
VAPLPAEPAGHFVYQLANQSGSVHYITPTKDITLDLPSLGMPARAALSPDGAWLAFRIDGDASGLSDYYVLRISDGKLVALGRSLQPAYGLGEQLAWSGDSYLAYTLTAQDGRSDVWVYRAYTGEAKQLTNTGDAFAASFMPNDNGQGVRLWVSRASAEPASYLVNLPSGGAALPGPFDPSTAAAAVRGVFEPLVASDGKHVIFWRGTMGTPGGHWSFSEGAMPWLADVNDSGEVDFANARQVFSTLAGGREMFRGASIAWGPDSDAFAVWNAQWTGVPQGDRFPDSNRVYFGHLSNPELITAGQTLDEADTKGASTITDVALAADGSHLALTVVTAEGSEGGTYGPTAQLRLVTRGYGTDPDKVEIIGQDKVWNGPAVYAGFGQP